MASTGFDSAREGADPATEVTNPAAEVTDSAREVADPVTEVANSATEATDWTKEVTNLTTVPTDSATVKPKHLAHTACLDHVYTHGFPHATLRVLEDSTTDHRPVVTMIASGGAKKSLTKLNRRPFKAICREALEAAISQKKLVGDILHQGRGGGPQVHC
jgi:hypothetical protein